MASTVLMRAVFPRTSQRLVFLQQVAKLLCFCTRAAIYSPLLNWLCEFISTIALVRLRKLLGFCHRSQATRAVASCHPQAHLCSFWPTQHDNAVANGRRMSMLRSAKCIHVITGSTSVYTETGRLLTCIAAQIVSIFVFQEQLAKVYPNTTGQYNMISALFVGILIILLVRLRLGS